MTTTYVPIYGLNSAGKAMTAECADHHGHDGFCSHCAPGLFRFPCVNHAEWWRKEQRRRRIWGW